MVIRNPSRRLDTSLEYLWNFEEIAGQDVNLEIVSRYVDGIDNHGHEERIPRREP